MSFISSRPQRDRTSEHLAHSPAASTIQGLNTEVINTSSHSAWSNRNTFNVLTISGQCVPGYQPADFSLLDLLFAQDLELVFALNFWWYNLFWHWNSALNISLVHWYSNILFYSYQPHHLQDLILIFYSFSQWLCTFQDPQVWSQ